MKPKHENGIGLKKKYKESDLCCPWPKCDGRFETQYIKQYECFKARHVCFFNKNVIDGLASKTKQGAINNWMSFKKKGRE